jgi:hypothetical protein
MAIVSFEVDLKPNNITWEERKAQLAAQPIRLPSESDLEEIPEMTEEELAKMVSWGEAKAYRATKKQQATSV